MLWEDSCSSGPGAKIGKREGEERVMVLRDACPQCGSRWDKRMDTFTRANKITAINGVAGPLSWCQRLMSSRRSNRQVWFQQTGGDAQNIMLRHDARQLLVFDHQYIIQPFFPHQRDGVEHGGFRRNGHWSRLHDRGDRDRCGLRLTGSMPIVTHKLQPGDNAR